MYIPSLPPMGGGIWYFHTYVGSGHFWGFKILNFSIFFYLFFFWGGGGFRKMNIFGVWTFCGYFFGGQTKIGLYLGVISMHFRVFSKGQGTEWGIFLGVAKISNIFWGCLKLLIIFGGEWSTSTSIRCTVTVDFYTTGWLRLVTLKEWDKENIGRRSKYK